MAFPGGRSLSGPCCLIADSAGGKLDMAAGAAGWTTGVK